MNCCRNKRRYSCEAKAKRAAKRAAERTGELIHHYKCPFGGPFSPHFHIGHPIGWKKAQKMRESMDRLNTC